MKLPVHRWFRYSAGFSAEWAKHLLESWNANLNARVLDPFAGSGTTLLAADAYNLCSTGVDAHPFVVRVAKAKLRWDLSPESFEQRVKAIRMCAQQLEETYKPNPEDLPELLRKVYDYETFRKLDSLRLAWKLHDDGSGESELAWLAITSILRVCSHAGTAPWQYILPKKTKSKTLDPFEAIDVQRHLMHQDMLSFQAHRHHSQATMLSGDARKLADVEDESVDFIVTSPPYANNYDYADATRLEMTFWREVEGWGDLQDVVRKYLIRSCTQHVAKERLRLSTLLGDPCLTPILSELEPICRELQEERHLHGGKKQYHLMVAAYFSDMSRVWQALRRVSKEDVKICFVIGDSAPYGIYLPVARWHGLLARSAGFDSIAFEKTRDRNIKWRNRTHSVLLGEGQLKVNAIGTNTVTEMDAMAKAGSATHKLGQMIGNFFENFFEASLEEVAKNYNLYCDSKGARPKIRGNRKKVTWKDDRGTPHDLDYVLEREASETLRGKPVAFLELAWRRYTKHSRNKAGEIEGALYHLGNTYPDAFLGAILAGEWSEGSLEQMQIRGINILHIPFEDISATFDSKGINLRYEEKSSEDIKWDIIEQWEKLNKSDLEDLERTLSQKIHQNLQPFLEQLTSALERRVVAVRVWALFSKVSEFPSAEEAINALANIDVNDSGLEFAKFEIQLRFGNGDKIEGEFREKETAIGFLRKYASSV